MSAQRATRISRGVILLFVAAVLALAASASASVDKLTVKVGTNKTYTRSQLHPGEVVLCRYEGHTLSATAPTGNEEAVGAGWPKPGTTDRSIFTLNVNVTSGRMFTVTCALGGYHSAFVTVPLPGWLPGAEKQALTTVFGGAKPIHIASIPYPHKIAVIFEFNHVVICQTCGGPTNASTPRGRVIRVSFDRRTHRLNGTMQFCESQGTQPSRALCIRR